MAGSLLSPVTNSARMRVLRATHRISDINVTPFVDVMLVLLVVFMIAAPLISTNVPVNLPSVDSNPITDQEERLAITLNKDGKLYIMDTEIEPDALVPRMQAIAEAKKETRISLRADADQHFGAVLDLMDQLRSAGFAKVDLIFDPMEMALSAQRAQAVQAAPQAASQPPATPASKP